MLRRLALAAEYRDDNTREHTERVAALAARLGQRLGLSELAITHIRHAAPLHDVGKIAIPDSILLKPGRLSAAEFEVVKTHAEAGARVLAEAESELLEVAESIARSHHERWDGTGYPDALAGADIPLVGRLVHVADVFDVLVHERPYKDAFSVEDAAEEIAGRRRDAVRSGGRRGVRRPRPARLAGRARRVRRLTPTGSSFALTAPIRGAMKRSALRPCTPGRREPRRLRLQRCSRRRPRRAPRRPASAPMSIGVTDGRLGGAITDTERRSRARALQGAPDRPARPAPGAEPQRGRRRRATACANADLQPDAHQPRHDLRRHASACSTPSAPTAA